jgi:dTDP-4-dehydrorhamnose 3,5-epimerase
VKVEPMVLPEVLLITPTVRGDARGAFHESWQLARYAEAGLPTRWVQDNASRSVRDVLRGLHLQHPRGQGKLVSVMAGEIVDVAVDVRRGSPTFGRSVQAVLSAATARQLFIPAGFAHGFVVTSDEAVVHYKCTEYYSPADERILAWDDPALGIAWPVSAPILSDRDARGRRLVSFAPEELPDFEPAG